MKKKILMATLFVAGSLTVMADDLTYLTAAYNGVEQSIELATIKKITFENNDVVVYTSNGEVRFAQNEMEKMFFSSTATAIEALPQATDGLKVANGVLHVSGQKGVVRIFGSNGTLQRVAKVDGNAAISLSGLSKGVYVVQMGNQTIKVSK